MTRRTAERNERFYAFYTSNREVSNAKTPDVKGSLRTLRILRFL